MRDVTINGGIGDQNTFNINDQHEGPKLLVQCTNEELRDERRHRQRLVAQVEHKRTVLGIAAGAVFVVDMLVWLALDKWQIEPGLNGLAILAGLALASLYALLNLDKIDGTFMQRQQAVLREIYLLLRERGDS